MAESLMGPATGLTNSKLALADATEGQVLSGKKFYAGDKTLKTGAMTNRGNTNYEYNGSNLTVGSGYHAGGGVISVSGGNKGNKGYTYSGYNQTIEKGWYNGSGTVSCAGGNQGAFSRTINPGGSVTIPQGYHNGGGRITANAITSSDITGRLRSDRTKIGVNVGNDRYIVGITLANLTRYPGDGSSENGEWSYIGISNDHHSITGAGNGAGDITYTYIQL